MTPLNSGLQRAFLVGRIPMHPWVTKRLMAQQLYIASKVKYYVKVKVMNGEKQYWLLCV